MTPMTTDATMVYALKINQVAERLGVTRAYVYKLIDTGELASVDVSMPGAKRGMPRILLTDLEAYLERIRHASPLGESAQT